MPINHTCKSRFDDLGKSSASVTWEELHACAEVRLVELVGDVPANGAKLAPLLPVCVCVCVTNIKCYTCRQCCASYGWLEQGIEESSKVAEERCDGGSSEEC
eukprot:1158208-Pelagomonas_calceolata.AAC.5